VGTVVLVEEDRETSYARTLARCFMAQGIAMGHTTALATAEEDPKEIWRGLPSWLVEGETELTPATTETTSDTLKIAWRYHSMGKSMKRSKLDGSYVNQFDFSRPISSEILAAAELVTFDARVYASGGVEALYFELKKLILSEFDARKVPIDKASRRLLRIYIPSFASPLWSNTSAQGVKTACQFLHALRGLLRHTYATCLITFPAYLFEHRPSLVRRIERWTDTVIRLRSFSLDDATTSANMGYQGLLHLHRAPGVATLLPVSMKLGWVDCDMGFKLHGRRKVCVVERFHLPPEGGVVERRIPGQPTSVEF